MIRISGIKININNDDINEILFKIKKKYKMEIKDYTIRKKSIDARKKPDIYYVYTLDIDAVDENKLIKKYKDIIKVSEDEKLIVEKREFKFSPVIIGAGPSGIFSALILARAGAKPIIIEQGEEVDSREKSIKKFFITGELNEASNVQYGEGGAGTFSDGKLNTSVKDKRNRWVLEELVKAGAKEEILYMNKPHIGTDKLVEILKNIRKEIVQLGGKFEFSSKMVDLDIKNSLKKITIEKDDKIEVLTTDRLILAIGNSARDTFYMLMSKDIDITAKPYAVGYRIIHTQKLIDRAMYGKEYKELGAADYKLTHHIGDYSIYSFCMCPGGYVVNASSKKGYTVVNGMSYSKRNSSTANSAIVCGVSFATPKEAIEFQEELEKRAYNIGKGKIPVSTLKAFIADEKPVSLGEVDPNFKGEYTLTNIRGILPKDLEEVIISSIKYFGTRIEGFDNDDVLLAGVETRTSSPIRINRDKEYYTNIDRIYPIGEGAGYAGGIMSAAIDGIKIGQKILQE